MSKKSKRSKRFFPHHAPAVAIEDGEIVLETRSHCGTIAKVARLAQPDQHPESAPITCRRFIPRLADSAQLYNILASRGYRTLWERYESD